MVELSLMEMVTKTDTDDEIFFVGTQPVMQVAINALSKFGNSKKITLKGIGESCPNAVAVANILRDRLLKGTVTVQDIKVDAENDQDGRMVSTITLNVIKQN